MYTLLFDRRKENKHKDGEILNVLLYYNNGLDK